MREVEVLKRLDHPGIVKYLGMQRKKRNLNIALEYVLLTGAVRACFDQTTISFPHPSSQIRRERFPGTNTKGIWQAK